MPMIPLKWREGVIEHYGSIANFGDYSTVTIVREHIEKEQKDIAQCEQIARDNPGVIEAEALTEMREKGRKLADLDAELALWLENRKSAIKRKRL
jgi:hypothetical protein